MALFWIVQGIDCGHWVFLQKGSSLILARLHAAVDGFGGRFVEARRLDAATAKKIPAKMTDRTLSATEAAALLGRIG